jgi:tRNA A37 N6-isopentenylltransferase MiaA
MLAGQLPREELAAAIGQNTRALVKKQRTWFKHPVAAAPGSAADAATVRTCLADLAFLGST